MDAHSPDAVLRTLRTMERPERWRTVAAAAIRMVVIAAALLGLYFALPYDRASLTATWLTIVLVLVLLVLVNVFQLRAVAKADVPWLRGVEALVVSVLLVLVTFAAVYLSMSGRDAAAFDEHLDHVASLYFTLTTLTTIGFGDIAPVSSAARVAVMVQMVANVVVVGVFVRLVLSTVRTRLSDVASQE